MDRASLCQGSTGSIESVRQARTSATTLRRSGGGSIDGWSVRSGEADSTVGTCDADVHTMSGLAREVVSEVIEAIGDELAAMAADDPSAVHLRGGRQVGRDLSGEVWSFEFDGGLPVPPETPGVLLPNDDGDPESEPISVTVLAVGEFDLVLGLNEVPVFDITRSRLSVQPWFILTALRDRLQVALDEADDLSLLESLLDIAERPDAGPPLEAAVSALPLQLGRDQVMAAARAARGGLQFVWGPPGTGKTSTLAGTAGALALAGTGLEDDGVLVTAHANAAVDVAIARIAEAMAGTSDLADGRVLRVGRPQLDVVRRYPDVLLEEVLARDHPDLVQKRRELDVERVALSRRMHRASSQGERKALLAQLEDVRSAYAEAERLLKDARTELVANARLIACTLSKLVLDDTLWRRSTGAVIVDEASMSGLPFLVGIALRSPKNLACFGDFRQLPPIALSNSVAAQRWFGRDAFELAGVVDRVDAGEADERLSMLRTQYRMGRDIAEVVSDFAYSGLLHNNEATLVRAEGIAERGPVPGASIVVVDTGGLGTSCLREVDQGSFSRVNPLSGAVAASVAQDALASGHPAVGVVTPYRAQARFLAGLLRGASVTVATTHRFQGSERDVMVVDLVDALPQTMPSRLTGTDRALSLRLLNVAASRAKGKLVVLVDLTFVRENHPFDTPARRLLDLCFGSGAACVDAAELVTELEPGPVVRWASSWSEAGDALAQDLLRAPADLDVSLSEPASWVNDLVDVLPVERRSVVVRAPIPVAVALEQSKARLHLRPLGPGPLAFAGADRLLIGSREHDGPAASVTSAPAVSVARRLLLE